jgi:parB
MRKNSPSKKPSAAVPVADTFTAKRTDLDRRTTIYLAHENWEALKIRSVREGRNVSEIINSLVADYLDNK